MPWPNIGGIRADSQPTDQQAHIVLADQKLTLPCEVACTLVPALDLLINHMSDALKV